uniref:Kell blood group glycoprotein-like n=2 Tax=Salarias fasciatus TaxID=181472 RepID=A0A672FZK6_SALFA
MLQQQQLPEQLQNQPLWIKHKRPILLLLGLSLCAAILGLIFYTHYKLHTKNNNQPVTPCVSPACRKASARLSTSIDPFTQPCDYFLFTCGSDTLWQDSGSRQRGQGIPGHPQNQMEKSAWPGRVPENEEKLQRRRGKDKTLNRKTVLLQHLKEILESNDMLNSSAVQKAKGFYHSCLDTSSLENTGAEPFLTLVQKLGGWAVSGKWNRTDFNSTLRLLMRDYATFPFFNLYVGKDPNEIGQKTTKRYIQIDQPDLLIPIEWNSKTQKSEAKTETLRPFLASCQRYLAMLGAPPSNRMIHVGLFISLSSELAVAASPLHYRLVKGQLHQRMTIKELQEQAPAIDWLGCLQATFHPLSLSEDDHVLLHNLPYIAQMSRIITKWLNKHETSTSGPLHTFMVLSLLHTMMPAMDSRFSDTRRNFSVILGNTDQEAPRWKHCVLETERGFGSVLTHLLSERTAQREAEETIQNVFSTFKAKLHELNWMDQKTHQLVMEKIHSFTPRLWTSEEISRGAELDLTFSEVTVSTHSFFSNYVQLLSLWQKRRSKLLTDPSEPADIMSVTPVLLGKDIVFPVGMFIPPLFHSTYPRAMNYGAAGFLITKDIIHLLLPEILSHSETMRAVGKCVWDHYLTVTDGAGRGSVSRLSAAQQQELWLQYFALQVALQAYQQSLRQRPGDSSLSGLSHTHLFLTAFSQINCDTDPYWEFMPLEPSFLITVICAKTNLCPTSLQCSLRPQQSSVQTC